MSRMGALNFATNHKPLKEVTLWDKADRLCEDQAIENIVQFMKVFNMWWLKLQPTGCVMGGSLLPAFTKLQYTVIHHAVSWDCLHFNHGRVGGDHLISQLKHHLEELG